MSYRECNFFVSWSVGHNAHVATCAEWPEVVVPDDDPFVALERAHNIVERLRVGNGLQKTEQELQEESPRQAE